ncbi:hypothetical protein M409DRAFT_58657 [Zasmidium cellare ATCC 36951]|uniref:Uncharacterized protein n=1 Tax=Zasmidium cellare ATCC 36951 TaxID=1080233 RepID=A0A6A6C8W5_ZASCE|nr:uncharacterized protein M409DRAFT_58657 [Zasmidium cellare ATCC 36951]KAF2161876.1 hypothetical protein M409DRAFT_58657 [Zasmidium cellare ATCC 36951]
MQSVSREQASAMVSPPQTILPKRPPMRMKDSDDYLTARGANPRTGLISPSVGTRTPCTPDSPGDALKLHTNDRNSPTPHPKTRPSLSRANEGRKISGGHTRTKRTATINGMQCNSPHSATSHQTPRHEVEQDHVRRSSPTLTEDSFVVHMPSAREPQPFAYPGYTAEQIEALEHYQRKTRQVSNEGYDRRLLQNCGKPSTTLSAAECDNTPTTDENGPVVYTCPTGQHFFAYRYHDPRDGTTWPDSEPPQLHVRKRKTPIDKIRQELTTSPRVEAQEEAKHVFLTSPFTPSPKITTTTSIDRNAQTIRRSVPSSEAHPSSNSCTSKHAQICSATGEISGKSIFGSAPSCTNVANAATAAAAGGDLYHADGVTKTPSAPGETVPDAHAAAATWDLCGRLPRVRLVRPELAAVPRGRRQRQETRGCSLGCRGGECIETRKASSCSTVICTAGDEESNSRQVSTSFVDPLTQQARASSNDSRARILYALATLLLDYARGFQARLPGWIAVVVETLCALALAPGDQEDLQVKERLELFKASVSLLGHGLAVCAALAMVWKVGVVVVSLVEVLLWPLAVPVRVLRYKTRTHSKATPHSVVLQQLISAVTQSSTSTSSFFLTPISISTTSKFPIRLSKTTQQSTSMSPSQTTRFFQNLPQAQLATNSHHAPRTMDSHPRSIAIPTTMDLPIL